MTTRNRPEHASLPPEDMPKPPPGCDAEMIHINEAAPGEGAMEAWLKKTYRAPGGGNVPQGATGDAAVTQHLEEGHSLAVAVEMARDERTA